MFLKESKLLSIVAADDAVEHDHDHGAGHHAGSNLISGSVDHQHLDGTVVGDNVHIVLEADFLSLTGAEELGAVLAAQSDDSHAGCNCRDDAAEQPQLLEECCSSERSSAAILGHQGAGDIHGQDGKDDGVVSRVENGEVVTLLRVVG